MLNYNLGAIKMTHWNEISVNGIFTSRGFMFELLKCLWLLFLGGSLIFDRKDVELNAEYILVTNGGLFQVSSSHAPN